MKNGPKNLIVYMMLHFTFQRVVNPNLAQEKDCFYDDSFVLIGHGKLTFCETRNQSTNWRSRSGAAPESVKSKD